MAYPADDGFFMPAEWTPHGRCWMEWPTRAETWGERIDAAREAYGEVAEAIARFEPVTMITKPKNVAEVSLLTASGMSPLPPTVAEKRSRGICVPAGSSRDATALRSRSGPIRRRHSPRGQRSGVAESSLSPPGRERRALR